MVRRVNNPQNPYGTYGPPNNCPPGSGGYQILSDNQMASVNLGKTVQLFFSRPSIDAMGDIVEYISNNRIRVPLTQGNVDAFSERSWIVAVNAIEIVRTGTDDVPAVRLAKDRILSLADKPDPGDWRYSTLQAEIIWMDGSAKSHVILIDIAGGRTVSVFGRNVQVNVLAPEGTQIIEDGSNPGTEEGALLGIVSDAIVSAKVAPETIGNSCWETPKFTKYVQIASRAIEFIAIPPGSQRVRVYNSAASVLPTTELSFFIGNDILAGYSIGVLDFVNTNSTDLFEIPCGATHIATMPDVGGIRYLTFVFMIDL